ncbi:MAG: glycosyltransferase family 2 protein [Deltaproteobacteria bacterium]|nr:glycosyltransferase family 2 protein [Deltaproteobacteria bacterium]
MIRRAVDSCLAQTGATFEVLVVDDGSTDGTAEVVEALGDPRVTVLRHPVNRGVCAARNTAIARARGRWCALVDSDFELLPGALEGLLEACSRAPEDVGNVASRCVWDNGLETPRPDPGEELLLDYPGYLKFVEDLSVSEWFNCMRREVFDRVRFPETRAYEGGFHLRVARRFRFLLLQRRSVKIYTDAKNRVTLSAPPQAARRMLRDARDSAREAEAVLAEHAEAFRAHAPRLLHHYAEAAFLNHLLAGERLEALRWLPELGPRPGARTLVHASLGLLGPRPLAWAKAHWTWGRHRPRAAEA